MRIDILTLFTDMCDTVTGESIIGRAKKKGAVEIYSHQIRDYTLNRQKQVDDAPFGGGMGMIMQAQPICDCYNAVRDMCSLTPHVIYMSPKGRTLNQEIVKELSEYSRLIIICGHYEGVDQRAIDELVDEEISIGDYVLTGGELPALVLADAVSRMVPGVLSSKECYEEESFYSGLLEYPQYSRPRQWHGMEVPEVLLSGDHKKIAHWRRKEQLKATLERRPDMLEKADLSKADKKILREIKEKN